MTTLLCATPGCRLPNRHATGCTTDTCRGCLPAVAADGLMLCRLHTDRLAPDATEAARLHGELALCLIGSGGIDEVRASNPQPGLSVREAIVEHRATIRHRLVSWTLLIADERGVSLPWYWRTIALPDGVQGPPVRLRSVDHSTAALGKFIAAHAMWLAGLRELAADASAEMAELVAKGRSLRQPSGTRVVEIGPCPQAGDEGPCTGTLRALLRREASLFPSAVTCDANEEHTWDSTQWSKLGRKMRVGA